MVDYEGCIKKIEGELLIICISGGVVPLRGIAGHVDWMLNAVISKAIAQKKYRGLDGETLLVNSKDMLPVDKTILLSIGAGKSLKSDVIKILRGLRTRSYSITLPKSSRTEFRGKEYDLGDEKLIVIKESGIN